MAAVAVNSFSDPVGHERNPDKDRPAPSSGVNDVSAVFHRRIEFHSARKPYSGFSEQGNSGFKLVTLNPNSNPNLNLNLNSRSNSEPKKAGFAGSGKGSSEVALERGRNGLGKDPELSFSITFRRIGAGLQNLGNTCFLNSVLQCLTYTEPLAAYLQSGRHIASCRKAGFCALCAIQKHVRVALESSGRILAPKDLVSNLRCISRTFRNARQEDAHEYMVNLLESMHKCCLPSGMPSESPGAYEKSLVHKIFGGRLRSQVKCTQCSFCSDKFDPFLDLSLEIARLDSLQKALAHFTAAEQLDGGEKHYQCQRCKQKVRALKQLTIDKPPEVLAIHLKRFGSHNPGQKIDRQIHFSPTLDLKPFVSGPYDGNLKYTLYGVLVHHGWSTHSGHYYCFVRTSSGMWYSLDDNRVVQVSEKRVLEQKAYMLFYVRDRKFSLSKKTADMLHKENVASYASGRIVLSNGSQGLKENMPNGIIEKKLNDSLSSEDAKKQVPKPVMSKEIQMKGDSHLRSNGPVAKVDSLCNENVPIAEVNSHGNGNDPTAEVDSHKGCNSPSKEHPSENPLMVSSAVGLGNALPVVTSNVELCAVSSLKESGSVDLSNSANEASITKGGLQVPVIQMNDSNGFHTSFNKNGAAFSVPPSDNNSRAGAVNGVTSDLGGPLNSNRHLDVCTPKEINAGKVGSSNKTGLADSSVQKADDVNAVAKSSLPRKKALDDKLHTVKVKPLKRLISVKRLSTSIIFGASFVRRKKRHRTESPTKVGKNNSVSDLGPSTSEESKASSVKISKKRVKRGSNDTNKNFEILGKRKIAEIDDLQKGLKDETCGDRIVQNGKSTTGPSSSLTLNGKPSDAGISVGAEHKQRDLVENGLVNMLTRGLEETTVARWDGVEHPSAFVEPRSEKSLRIGYVGDEWDEEYDAGKRKKIRNSSILFDGSNPFQAIATRKAKAKHGKVNRNSSANQPFRI